MIQLQLFGLL